MGKTILIVDDSLTVRMDLLEAFEGAGFRCLPCSTAGEARRELATDHVDLVVLDVLLPDGDGVELLGEIRGAAHSAALPVLMLSAEAEVRDRIRGLKTGADEYVGKPYDTLYVVSRVRELLREPVVATGDRPSILVIDDSLTFREELGSAIESAGYAVIFGQSGEEGLRLAADKRPDAVIVDGVLPGIDGPTVIRRIRLDAVLRGTPCVLLTASEEHGAELRAFDAGADAFVRKGEDIDVILARLAAVLRGASSSGRETTTSLLGPKKILAVDDSPTYLNELAGALQDDGYDVVLAHSGEDALDLLGVEPFDCILLDLAMPGMGGKETCRRIKAAPMVRDIPLIILTAQEDGASMIDGLSTGADDYIQKSTEFEVLRARMRAQMRRKQFEDENRRIREELLRKELETVEARSARQIAEERAALVGQLERQNQELEAFTFSVSHDLRAPLRGVFAFSTILREEFSSQIPAEANELLNRVINNAERMERLIEDLLRLSSVDRQPLSREPVNITSLVKKVLEELSREQGDRQIRVELGHLPNCIGDQSLLGQVFVNLLSNAFKFTLKSESAAIEVGSQEQDGERVYFVRDNGAGFEMKYARRLFGAFQRFHRADEFEGTGVGLSIVQRIISRHGGRIWAEAAVNKGATFFFTLGERELNQAEILAPEQDEKSGR